MQTILPVDIRCLKFARLWMASYQERALSRSARLLALLQALRCRRRPVTAAALARELQVSERTIYRDLSELASQGAPVQGEAGVGYMRSRKTKRKPSCQRGPHQSCGKCPRQDTSGPTP